MRNDKIGHETAAHGSVMLGWRQSTGRTRATLRACLAAALFLSRVAFADPPADAPLRSVHVEAGQPAPFAGRLLSSEEFVASERQCADAVAFKKAALKDDAVRIPAWAVVAIAAAGLAVGASAGVAVVVAVKK